MRTAYQKLRQQQWVLLLGNSPVQALNRTLGARRAGGMLVLGLVLTLGVAQPASAESLKDALSAAYGYNPRLDAQRAFQRATDEDVARAMSGYRPTVTGNADIGIERTDQRPSISSRWRDQAARLRHRRRAADLQRVSHLQRGEYRGSQRARRARGTARRGAQRAAAGGNRLYGRGARSGAGAPQREQRQRPVARIEGRAGPVRRRRGDAHGRGAGRGPPCRRGFPSRRRARQLAHQPWKLPARHRPSAERAGLAGHAGTVSTARAERRYRRQQQRGSAGRLPRCSASRPPNIRSSRSAASCCRRCSSRPATTTASARRS